MLKFLLGTFLFIFLIMVIGGILLEEFPSLLPIWEEIKMHAVTLYDMSMARYGAVATILLIVAIFILIGSSKNMK